MTKAFDRIPSKIATQAIEYANNPKPAWGAFYVNYCNDFHEWFVNPFVCDLVEDAAVTVGYVDMSTKTLVPYTYPNGSYAK